MAPQFEDDWSDSDEEDVSDTITAVQLGVSDGPLESESDLRDAAVSRIGGLPVRASRAACTCTAVEYISFWFLPCALGILDVA
jgi:hypothetical protein